MDLAAALQAGAAIVQGLAAVVIVYLTRRLTTATEEYAKLTRDLAIAARAQQDVHAQQAAADYDRLLELVEQLLAKARELPDKTNTALKMLDVVLWSDQDLRDVMQLAANRGLTTLASKAIEPLRWLGRCVEMMQVENRKAPGAGVDWQRISWNEWAHHLTDAREALNRLHGALEMLYQGTMGNLVERAGGIEHVSMHPTK
jgi:hypothetical protein